MYVYCTVCILLCRFFFFNDTATTEIYTLSLHDALPIYFCLLQYDLQKHKIKSQKKSSHNSLKINNLKDRKSTRLNSSHANISYAVFCLKKKKKSHPNLLYEQSSKSHLTPNNISLIESSF